MKDRLVRGGILLLALGPESLTKKTKMERWQFALPVQFARHLPPLVESKRLSGEGDLRSDAAREKLKTAIRPGADGDTKEDRVEVIERLHAAKINSAELGVVVQRFGEVAPVHSERVYR